MTPKEALAYAKKATHCRYPFAAEYYALLPLTREEADRAQVVSRPHPLGGIEFFATDTLTGRVLAPGWIVAGASAAERKRYTTELLVAAWQQLAQDATPPPSGALALVPAPLTSQPLTANAAA